MKTKITLALLAIAVTLLVSSVISVLEYSNMSNYVSELIAGNIKNINAAQKLANSTNEYNLQILAIIGDDSNNRLPDFDQQQFVNYCDSLRADLAQGSANEAHLADSVMYSYSAYMLTSLELPDVILSPFTNTRDWYFDRLQPVYNRLRGDIDNLSTAIYKNLQVNSETFDRGFYRSVIPGSVAVGTGLLLVLLLLFYLLAYYANPIYKMLRSLDNYRSLGKKYEYTFDGDDELSKLNEGIREITADNQLLRKRIKNLRDKIGQAGESSVKESSENES